MSTLSFPNGPPDSDSNGQSQFKSKLTKPVKIFNNITQNIGPKMKPICPKYAWQWQQLFKSHYRKYSDLKFPSVSILNHSVVTNLVKSAWAICHFWLIPNPWARAALDYRHASWCLLWVWGSLSYRFRAAWAKERVFLCMCPSVCVCLSLIHTHTCQKKELSRKKKRLIKQRESLVYTTQLPI